MKNRMDSRNSRVTAAKEIISELEDHMQKLQAIVEDGKIPQNKSRADKI